MINGVEVCLVVNDSEVALRLYEHIFEAADAEVFKFEDQSPEAVFLIYNGRYRLVNQKPKHRWFAPVVGASRPIWVNIAVPDIQKTFDTALAAGCDEIQPIREIPEIGVKTAVIEDPFGHVWMLQQFGGGVIGTGLFMVVPDSIAVVKLYEQIFDVDLVDVSGLDKGQNEAIFNIYNGRFHLLDENPAENILAPRKGDTRPIWASIAVPDIQKTLDAAINAGCEQISPIGELLPGSGVQNAIFSDPFGYIWMILQIDTVIST